MENMHITSERKNNAKRVYLVNGEDNCSVVGTNVEIGKEG